MFEMWCDQGLQWTVDGRQQKVLKALNCKVMVLLLFPF